MGFESLLGNERLKENLRSSINRGRISHFYLIAGPEGSGKRTLARLLAAAILCKSAEKPCGVCPACRKVLGAGHPDFITIDDPEKKTVSVDLIRQARADIYIRTNESDHKIYLFPRAQDMGIPGQNALLKVLEEPPSYGVFLLLTIPKNCCPQSAPAAPSWHSPPLIRRWHGSACGRIFPMPTAGLWTRPSAAAAGIWDRQSSFWRQVRSFPRRQRSFWRPSRHAAPTACCRSSCLWKSGSGIS